MSASIEIEDGFVTFRDGPVSITVKADQAIIFNVDAGLPAKSVPISDNFWEEATEYLNYPKPGSAA